jgi:DNA integrity scanning protein DisA with diadenylate cyclase activity
MIAATEDDMDEHVTPSALSGIKEKLEVTDLINQLDIADGLKELLLSSNFTLESLLNASVSDFAKTLGIDEHVAKLVSDAVNKAIKRSRSIP